MHPVEIKPGIYWTGINDRSTELFEGLWPILHQGVSYNAYVIKDEKNVLIDLSKETFTDDFIQQISEIINPVDLDYVIVNHMEPDHSGALNRLLELAPHARLIGMPKAIQMVKDFYNITENVEALSNGQTLSLGKHTLQFIYTPMVHWPETMVTYDIAEKVLFSCDAFGSFGALDGTIFDDTSADLHFYETEALRYYTNIVAAFSKHVLSAIEKLKDVAIEVIAPSHGLVWRKDPARILNLYKKWATYGSQPAEPGVTLLYGSMYRNTEHAMNYAAEAVAKEGVPVEVFDVGVTQTSFILPSLWTRRGVLIAAPTYERKMFPPMANMLSMAALKGVNKKIAGYFGSFAWSGGAKAEFDHYAEQMSWDVLGSVEFVGSAKPDQIKAIVDLATQVALKVKELSEV
jgi:flavorubredoxin